MTSDVTVASMIDDLIRDHGVTESFGISARGGAADRRSLFAAAGFDWPAEADPEAVHARQTDYPFSIDLGGARLAVALDRDGLLRRVVVGLGQQDVRGRTIPGVYTHKTVGFWQGRIGWDLRVDGEPARRATTSHSYVGGVLPVFGRRATDLVCDWVCAAPGSGDDQHIDQFIRVRNVTDRPLQVELVPVVEVDRGDLKGVTVQVLPVGEAGPGAVALTPGASREFEVRVVFATNRSAATPLQHGAVANAVRREALTRHASLGLLEIPGEPWYSGQLARLVMLAKQSGLAGPAGESLGSFWGSNANPIPDVWFRDFAYTTLALVEFDRAQALANVRYLCTFAIPERAWEREAEIHPEATGLEHALGNACLPAVIAARLVRVHGIEAVQAGLADIAPYLGKLAAGLTGTVHAETDLYSTLYISDGPSRGTFHTGSNILAWAALSGISGELRALIDDGVATACRDRADALIGAIRRRCVTDLGSFGPGYVEGIYADGAFVGVHDGEESDLTLASYYGFTGRDDSLVAHHAQWARSMANPYYSAVAEGVDFWDWDDYNGITYPAHAHALAAATDPATLRGALELIRRSTDADGSVWWWPFAHGETDGSRVKRGLGKCGWAAGVVVARLMHDVFGIRRDWQHAAVTVAPFLPWTGYRWRALPFGDGQLNVAVSLGAGEGDLELTNETGRELDVRLELPVPEGAMIEDIRLDGELARHQSDVVLSYRGSAVRIDTRAAPGELRRLTVQYRSTGC